MKLQKRILALALFMTMLISSTTVFATEKEEVNIGKSILPIRSIDGQEIKIPDKSKLQEVNDKFNKKPKTFAVDKYAQTKAVAEAKAYMLTAGYGCASAQYALIHNGEIVLSGSIGDNTNKDSMYPVASISKVFTTAAVMNLVEEGLIDLDAPITKYISDFKMADERYKNITPRMLLNHSSGIMGTSGSNVLLFNDNSTYGHDTFLNQLSKQRLKANPGEYSVYCNDGFTLAEILVERVTGNSFTSYIANNISNKLEMTNTKTPLDNFDRNKVAKAYYPGETTPLPVENLNVIGAGGVYSTAENICKFGTTFMNNSNGILTDKSLKAMENKEYLNGIWQEDGDNVFGYGLGWDSVNMYPFNQYGIKALTKGGDSIYYHSNLTVLPEENMAVAVITSGGVSTLNEVAGQEILLAALKETNRIDEIKADKVPPLPEQVTVPEGFEKYEGLYATMGNFMECDIDKEGILTVSYPTYPQQPPMKFIYTKEGWYMSEDGTIGVRFVEESNGKTYLHQKGYTNIPFIGQTFMDMYLAQKENTNPLTAEVSKAWENRKGKSYYLLNEKYSSTVYKGSCPVVTSSENNIEGYEGVNKIVDKNNAIAILDGPGMMSRDLADLTFYMENGHEYLSTNNSLFIEESGIKNLPMDKKFVSEINEKGYANWYKISNDIAGKEISIFAPEEGAFAVYDAQGNLVDYSLISKNKKATLPKDGTIVFVGNPYGRFTIEYLN